MKDQLGYEPPQNTLSVIPSRMDVAVVGLRLLGLYALFTAVFNAREVVFALHFGASNAVLLAALTPSAVAVAGAILLLVYAPALSHKILPRGGGDSGTATNHGDLQSTAFAVVGVYLVVSNLPTFVMILVFGASFQGYDPTERLWLDGTKSVIGVILFLQARGLARLWRGLRTAGTQPAANMEQGG